MNKIFSMLMIMLSCIGWGVCLYSICFDTASVLSFMCFGLNFGLTIVWTVELFKDA